MILKEEENILFEIYTRELFEKTLVQLLGWAELVVEKSLNQPALPHAIVVLNASSNRIDPARWDVDKATRRAMKDVQSAMKNNPDLLRYVQHWKRRGKEITEIEQLLSLYYSSFKVLCIPERGRQQLISQQVEKLYKEIEKAYRLSQEQKWSERMLLSSTELQPYISYAFDWFSERLDQPFDFVAASFATNPIPPYFGGNIIQLARKVMEVNHWTADKKLMGFTLFDGISQLIGSCIMLDSARKEHIGIILVLPLIRCFLTAFRVAIIHTPKI
ncbi:MAG: hypothetical protein M1814_005430 [Vezdaea aestivalis]|nr:MAG: hypothetical protein M1814_005430 [Vezdaea aestivalis]